MHADAGERLSSGCADGEWPPASVVTAVCGSWPAAARGEGRADPEPFEAGGRRGGEADLLDGGLGVTSGKTAGRTSPVRGARGKRPVRMAARVRRRVLRRGINGDDRGRDEACNEPRVQRETAVRHRQHLREAKRLVWPVARPEPDGHAQARTDRTPGSRDGLTRKMAEAGCES